MNPDTGDLMRVREEIQSLPEGYKKIPKLLEALAEKKLGNEQHVKIKLNSGDQISQWARKERMERKKAIRNAARAARRLNRK